MKNTIQKSIDEFKQKKIKGFNTSWWICFIIIIIQTLIKNFISLVTLLCIIAPITEEIGKRASIKLKITVTHLILFNIFEFLGHMVTLMFVQDNLNLLTAMSYSILPIGLHVSLTIIQKYYYDKNQVIGFYIALILHSLWNFTIILLTLT